MQGNILVKGNEKAQRVMHKRTVEAAAIAAAVAVSIPQKQVPSRKRVVDAIEQRDKRRDE